MQYSSLNIWSGEFSKCGLQFFIFRIDGDIGKFDKIPNYSRNQNCPNIKYQFLRHEKGRPFYGKL